MRKYDESFGIIPLTKEGGVWKVFLIQHNRSGYWGFPKGHAEGGERPQEAAFRELKEETNLNVVRLFQEEALEEQYTFIMDGKRVFKRVFYFVAEVEGSVKLQSQEIYDGKWCEFHEAISRVTHQEGKALLIQVEKSFLKNH